MMCCNHEYTNQEGRALEKQVIQLEQKLSAAKEELAELKDEILRCRTKEVHMDGVTYSTINASQVMRLHGKIAAVEEKP